MKRILLTALFIVYCSLFIGNAQTLRYEKPAATWTQALPLGNGTMGAMVYGTPANRRQLGHRRFRLATVRWVRWYMARLP